MYRGLIFPIALAAFASTTLGAPLIPTIVGHDFNFGAYNGDGTIEYATNALQPDTLVYTQHDGDHEVTAYWPAWPDPPVYPVWDLNGMPNFGGDLVLAAQFTGQDAPYVGPGGVIDVSLTGTGLNPGADLEIYGTIEIGPLTLSGLLWALDLEASRSTAMPSVTRTFWKASEPLSAGRSPISTA